MRLASFERKGRPGFGVVVGDGVVDLAARFDLTERKALRTGAVHACDAGHVQPGFAFAQAGNDDGAFVGDLEAFFGARFGDEFAQADDNELIVLAEIFGGDEI